MYTIPVYELIEIFSKTGLIYNICEHLFNLIACLLVLRPLISKRQRRNSDTDRRFKTTFVGLWGSQNVYSNTR